MAGKKVPKLPKASVKVKLNTNKRTPSVMKVGKKK